MTDGELNNKQEMALELVLQGKNDSEVANAVGVSRQWVNQWRNQDKIFMAALQLRRDMMREFHMDGMNQLITKAIMVLANELETGDTKSQVETAKYVLKVSGLKGYAKPTKEKSPKDELLETLEEALGAAAKEVKEKYQPKINKEE